MPETTYSRHLSQIADLCLRVGEVLLSSGAGAADVTVTMQAVADAYGQPNAEVDVTFTSLQMSLSHDDLDQPVVLMRSVRHRGIDYGVLTRTDKLVREMVTHGVELGEARRQMNQIVSSPRSMPRWGITVAWGLMCGAVSAYLGGGPLVAIVAFVTAVLIERAQTWLARERIPSFYSQVAGGVIATATPLLLDAAHVPINSSLVVTANIVMLLAGIGFLGALSDALAGFYITAGARLLEAMLSTAGIIAGVSLGLTLGNLMGVDLGEIVPGFAGWAGVPAIVVGGGVSAGAFAAACRAPRRAWLPVGVISGAASFLYTAAQASTAGRPWAAGTAAFFIGLVAYGVAGRFRVPPLVVAVSAIVPFLPGLSIYRGLALLGEGGSSAVPGLLAMFTAVSVAVALSSGVILGEYVAQPVKRNARRVEDRLVGPRMVGALKTRASRQARRARATS